MSVWSQRVREAVMHAVAIGSVVAVVIALRPSTREQGRVASPADFSAAEDSAVNEGASTHMKDSEHLKSCSVCRLTQQQLGVAGSIAHSVDDSGRLGHHPIRRREVRAEGR
jgi:hypothetical protein